MNGPHTLDGLDRELESGLAVARTGRVVEINGALVRVALPDVHLGELVSIDRTRGAPIGAQVVGFDRRDALVMPLGALDEVAANAPVRPSGERACVRHGPELRGRVVDALGEPLDGGPSLAFAERAPLERPPPSPLRRARLREPLATGVRALDAVLTAGRGQRVGIFAAAGGGKSTLLAALARNVAADGVVLALIGERGCEVREFVEDHLGAQGLARSTVVVSTSDQPALLRVRAAYAAMAIAEARRAAGEHVVLLVDSVTRFARALRDVGLAAGEAPGRQGFPASVYTALPRLFERAGTAETGSITAFFTVLVAGDDLTEPIADETMSLLDGHVVLSRAVAQKRRPAIDVLQSESRWMGRLVAHEHALAARRLREALALHARNYDALAMGLYKPPTPRDAELMALAQKAEVFLEQDLRAAADPCESVARLVAEFGGARG